VLDCTTPVNELLFKGLTRGIGYSYGQGANRRVMIDATLKQGALPPSSSRPPIRWPNWMGKSVSIF
jgi:hypothetical protein